VVILEVLALVAVMEVLELVAVMETGTSVGHGGNITVGSDRGTGTGS